MKRQLVLILAISKLGNLNDGFIGTFQEDIISQWNLKPTHTCNWPLQPFVKICLLLLCTSNGIYSLISNTALEAFPSNIFYSQRFWQKTAERKLLKEIFLMPLKVKTLPIRSWCPSNWRLIREKNTCEKYEAYWKKIIEMGLRIWTNWFRAYFLFVTRCHQSCKSLLLTISTIRCWKVVSSH